MPYAVGGLRKVWRRLTRAYHLACARDDAAARGLTVPSGVWACHLCQQPWLDLTGLRNHLTADHPRI